MNPEEPSRRIPWWAAGAAVAGLLALTVIFAGNLIGKVPEPDGIPKLSPEYSDPATVRVVRKEMTFDGTPCESCHDGKEPLQGNPKGKGTFHEKIELKHGRNQHCFNCHHRLNPANFSNFDGAPIKLANIELLCSKCHGTTYRDWLNNAHGRRTGFWAKDKGPAKPTVCIACHNPHWPVFKAIASAPRPHVNPRTQEKGADGARADARGEGGEE